jgi:hypothetical protein
MKKVSKTKTKSKRVSRKQTPKAKHYSVHLLVIAVALLITGETALAFNTNATDWKNGFAVLDVSEGVSSTIADVKFAAEPMVAAVQGVDEFYNQASIASTELLEDSSYGSDSLMFVFGVDNFYKSASAELANVLDLSNYTSSWPPQVAGASISR